MNRPLNRTGEYSILSKPLLFGVCRADSTHKRDPGVELEIPWMDDHLGIFHDLSTNSHRHPVTIFYRSEAPCHLSLAWRDSLRGRTAVILLLGRAKRMSMGDVDFIVCDY